MAASEYQRLIRSFADALGHDQVSAVIARLGWPTHCDLLPRQSQYCGPIAEWSCGKFLRSTKISIAPVKREVVIRGIKPPGDVDTTRTYDPAAARCSFLHQCADYVATFYDEQNELALWRDAIELACRALRWLPYEAGRQLVAAGRTCASSARLFEFAQGRERVTAN